jgi:glycogen synthase
MWDPASDPLLPPGGHFSAAKPEGKETCKAALLQQLGLPYVDPPHAPGEW